MFDLGYMQKKHSFLEKISIAGVCNGFDDCTNHNDALL